MRTSTVVATGTPSAGRELVRRALAGEREAYAAIYDGLSGDVQRFLLGLQLALDHQELEDTVQETFLRLYRLLPRFDPGRTLKPYVLGIARNVALEVRRQRKGMGRSNNRLQRLEDETLERLPAAQRVAEEVSRTEEKDLTSQALGALEADQRTVIVLRFVSGLTMQELADSLSCSVPTARSRLRRAAQRFSVELTNRGIIPEEPSR